jgi:hypothetical protein
LLLFSIAVTIFEEIFNGVQNPVAEYLLAPSGEVGPSSGGRSFSFHLSLLWTLGRLLFGSILHRALLTFRL